MDILESGSLKTYVRGKWLTIYVADIENFIEIPVVKNPDYPISNELQVPIDYDLVATTICGADTRWSGGTLPHGNLTDEYQFLNRFVCHNLEPRDHTSDVAHKKWLSSVLHRDREENEYPLGHNECVHPNFDS